MNQSYDYFTISDLVKDLDVRKSHIRFCEENGLIAPRVSKLKRRGYNRYDRERLKFIFHFVLIGYSKEQIIDLIGIADANLNENDQLEQGIDYALKELKNLEKRKEELSFTKQTRIINEIEMLREYIKRIKIIKSGVLEEPSQEPGIGFEEKTKIPAKPITAITAAPQKRATQHPVRTIFLFVTGLTLVILLGSYFYYKTGQKETKNIKLAQKKPIHSEKILLPQTSETADQTTKDQHGAQEFQPKATPTPEITPVTDGVPQLPEKGKSGSPRVEDTVKDDDPKEVAEGDLTEKAAAVAKHEGMLTFSAPEPVNEKAAEVEMKGLQEPRLAPKTVPTEDDISSVSEKGKSGSPSVEGTPKDDVQTEVAEGDLTEKAAVVAEREDTLSVSAPEPEKEKAADVEIKDIQEAKSAPERVPDADDISLKPEKQMLDDTSVEGSLKDGSVQDVHGERVKAKTVTDAPRKDKLAAEGSEPGSGKVFETEVKPFSAESEKQMEKMIMSEKEIHQQTNELSRLKSFLDEYCRVYSNKNLDEFITYFTSDATINNRSFHELLPDLRRNMESMESLTYRIELMSYSKQSVSENLTVRGRFFSRYKSQKGVWEEKNGSIFMDLLKNGDSFLVKQLKYQD